MKVDYLAGVQYEIIEDYAIIYLPKTCWTLTWGAMLELVRENILDSVKYIIIDFSLVTEIGDGSLESLILKKEFHDKGGQGIIHLKVPEIMKYLWNIFDDTQEMGTIPEFNNLSDAVDYISNSRNEHS